MVKILPKYFLEIFGSRLERLKVSLCASKLLWLKYLIKLKLEKNHLKRSREILSAFGYLARNIKSVLDSMVLYDFHSILLICLIGYLPEGKSQVSHL